MKRRHFLKSATAAGLVAAKASAHPQPSQASKDAQPPLAEGSREKVLGIGGVFFRSKNPDTLGRWYQEHLGIPLSPTTLESPTWNTEAGVTLFTPFPETTKYFGEPNQVWMLNFRVRDLNKMVAQLKADGIEAKVTPDGHFARLHDPEGNPIELWQPAK